MFVVTGGPGAGKTTLVNLLREHGFAVASEAGRAIIQAQSAIGGQALPWVDPELFAELMLSWDIRSYHWGLEQPGPVFFDHAIPGLSGYLRLLGRPVPAHFDAAAAAYPYHRRVFVAPPWREIYRTDRERHQSFDEAQRTYEALVAAYTGYGYEPVDLPRADPDERARFLLRQVAASPEANLRPTPPGTPGSVHRMPPRDRDLD